MIRKLVRQMLTAQIFSALTVSLCLLIDSIIIGRALGEQAIAAYQLANPILLVTGAIGSMLSAGVQVACSKSLGNGSQEETDRGYSSAIGMTVIISLALVIPVVLFSRPLAFLMGAGKSPELFAQTSDYLVGFIIGAPGSIGALILVPFLQMAGQSSLLICAVLAMTVADIALDLLAVEVLHWGMFGMGLASALSYYIAMAIAMIYFLSKKCVFTFSMRYITWKKMKELIIGGIPTVFTMASSVILVFILNRILLQINSEGSGAVAAYSVLMTIGNASNCISTGMNGVSLTLSGILFNEEDRTGLKELLHVMRRYAVILGAAVGVLLIILAPSVVSLYIPNAGNTQNMAILGLRLFALGLIPCCLNNILKSAYQGTERIMMTQIISMLEGAVLPALCALIFSRFWGVTGVWLYFFAGEALTLACVVLYVWRKSGRFSKEPSDYLLLSDDFGVQPEHLLEVDIHSMEEVTAAAKAAGEFCLSQGHSEKMSNHISLCVEEMAGNTVAHGFAVNGKNHLSVRIQHKGDQWVIRFRDDCNAFDPVHYVPKEDQTDALGIRLMMAMADEIRYTYSMNLNNLTLILNKSQME